MTKPIKNLICTLWFSLSWINAEAQTSSWAVNAADFEYSMTITALLLTDEGISADLQDKVAVFSGEQCRGVANVSKSKDKWGSNLIFLVVYSNSYTEEGLTFQYYDASQDKVVATSVAISFKDSERLGTVDKPIILTADQINRQPEALALSSNTIQDGSGIGTVIGQFTVADDQTEGHTYYLPEGEEDNDSFMLEGDILKAATEFNRSEKASYQLLVGVDDGFGGMLETMFDISVIAADSTGSQNPDPDPDPDPDSELPSSLSFTSIITPNGDGKNDQLQIIADNLSVFTDFTLVVYNASGLEVYRAVNYQSDWDGTYNGHALPAGAYLYRFSSPAKEYKGTFYIVQ
ncbi:gliding motility-associated C-terminal domain-containing protein [Limibacter armeniacum]|uniref:gliding motility-associated C-terminal domain-containing protein n=1 Tax=Limibacter armeniacum TaxID=466084 RepID=UPI002FE53F7A